MWFWLSIIALLCWSGSDLFSKIGCADARDKYSHLKMIMAVGLVMGLHACWEIFAGGTEISLSILLTYLPVSLLYILSMAMGYLGLRYIELSISSPVCNASGALVAILALITGDGNYPPLMLAAIALVCAGVIGLGVVEAREDDELRRARQEAGSYRYAKSKLALALPIAYCLLDAAGTFADSLVLEKLSRTVVGYEDSANAAYCLLDAAGTFADSLVLEKLSRTVVGYEDSANAAYELTFLAAGVVCFVYVIVIKKQRLVPKLEAPKYAGAIFETAGQLAYIYAIADTEHLAMSAPIISSYCAASVVWSRVFLREKLSKKHYIALLAVIAGIAIIGFFDA